MKYESISWEGALIGQETIEKLSDETALKGQASKDFGYKGKMRDEILRAWADARQQWAQFKSRKERHDEKDPYGTSRCRQSWIIPFLSLLDYNLENAPAQTIAEKSYAISHKTTNAICPVHIVGFEESLDKKRDGARMSPHSLMQEYLNVSDTLYGLITNGLSLRLLRDSSRLVKLTYLEFNLERMFEEDLFSDFIILFRLLHISRWPESSDTASDCFLEQYHQDSLENGSRIREKLSGAVSEAIQIWANALLKHPENERFRVSIENGSYTSRKFYDDLLTLVYRILFLLVIEERLLTHSEAASKDKKDIYRNFYSMSALRTRTRSMFIEDGRYYDFWESLKSIFSLYENAGDAEKLDLQALAGDLFSRESFELFHSLYMDNASFKNGLIILDAYYDEKRQVPVRVNYAALNVEEFGSIYEGLLDLEAEIERTDGRYEFCFKSGLDRRKSGSHYTPEELVQPLIEHALSPLIKNCLVSEKPEEALLALRICDSACGSGHILLNAARSLAHALARHRTGADNPDPSSYRAALREVIENCIYGVDFNPQAVRLCKVALWLESHKPGESLGFLDHHIKCGDSLTGLSSFSDLLVPTSLAAFATRDGDDKDYAARLRDRHKKEVNESEVNQIMMSYRERVHDNLDTIVEIIKSVSRMKASTPEETARKKQTYQHAVSGSAWYVLKSLADIKLAPFFLEKKESIAMATEENYRRFLNGDEDISNHQITIAAEGLAEERRFFHWFLEFPEVMQDGGFDCFLGNPPFLGGQKLSGTFGKRYLEYLKFAYAPAGSMDLVGFFVRRNYGLLKESRALGTLATNTIAQGGTREGGLEVIEKLGGSIVMAVRSRPWPGAAAVEVSLAAIYKGLWKGEKRLDGKKVDFISTYFDDQDAIGNPFTLVQNMNKSFQGSIVLGKGFVLEPWKAEALIRNNPKNKDVLFPYLNGEDLNSRSDQSPSRWVINFFDWPLSRKTAPKDYVGPVAEDYPDCLEIVEKLVKPERLKQTGDRGAEYWWQFLRIRGELYRTIAPLDRVLIFATQATKYPNFSFLKSTLVFSNAVGIIAFRRNIYYCILSSSLHECWSWKLASTMRGDMRYTPTNIFETFPFPAGFEPDRKEGPVKNAMYERLESLGQALDEGRKEIMLALDIGLTKLYNLFHTRELAIADIVKTAKCGDEDAAWAVEKMLRLREVHKNIDEAVRDAYGWDFPLQHGFYELEFLPENDRVRYTVSTRVRKLILTELLKLNHERHADEVAAGIADEKGKPVKKKPAKKKKEAEGQRGLF